MDEERQSPTSEHLEKLLEVKRHRLQLLEQKAARLGVQSSPEIQIEIQDIQKEIAAIEAKLIVINPTASNTTEEESPFQVSSHTNDIGLFFKSMIDEVFYVMKYEMGELRENNRRLIYTTEKLQDELARLREIIRPNSAIEGTQDLEEELNHQITLRREWLKRIRTLEIEQARKGIDAPPQVETQINDIRERIAAIDTRIKTLTYDLERIKTVTTES